MGSQDIYNDDGTVPTIITLETLGKQYDTLLLQYNQAQTDYVNSLKDDKLIDIKEFAFWGNEQLGDTYSINVSSIDDCKALCAKNTKCSGAIYNPIDYGKKLCFLRTGTGSIMPGLKNDYAIVPPSLKYLDILDKINSQLISVNQKLLDTIKTSSNIYTKQVSDRKLQYETLNKNHKYLIDQRNIIKNNINKYKEYDNVQKNTELKLTKNYYNYYFYFIIALIAIILLISFSINLSELFNFQLSQDSMMNPYYLLFIIIIIVLVVNYMRSIAVLHQI